MPPLPAVPNVLRVQQGWSASSDTTILSTQYYRYSGGPPTTTDAQTFAADIYSLWAGNAGLWDPTTFLDGVTVTDLSSSGGALGGHAQTTDGTRVGGPLPGSACALVAYSITRRYRGGKPRNYLPWGTDDDVNNRQTWIGSFTTAVDSAIAAIRTGTIGLASGTTTITDQVNVSYYDGFTSVQNPVTHRWRNVPTVRAVPVVDTIVTFSVKPNIASQRKRNR